MFDDEYYTYVKLKWEKRFFKIPGVRAVGLGPKFVKGQAIGEIAIQVFVEDKRPMVEINRSERIPSEISNIPTDVCLWREPSTMVATLTLGNCSTGNIVSVTEIKEGTNIIKLEIESPDHGLVDGVWITIRGNETDIDGSFSHKVTVINSNRFSIDALENTNGSIPFMDTRAPGTARWIKISTFDTLCCCPTGDITEAKPGPPVKITSPDHGLYTKDLVKIKDSGVQLLPVIFEIERVDKDHFNLLSNADPGFFSGDTTGWKWFKVSIALAGRVWKYEKLKPVIVHSINHGLDSGNYIIVNSTEPNFNNHLQIEKFAYQVTVLDNNRFTLKEKIGKGDYTDLDATTWANPPQDAVDFVAVWIRQTDDMHSYSPLRGGVRLEVISSEIILKEVKMPNGDFEWVEYKPPPMIDTSSTKTGFKRPPVENLRGFTRYNIGTMGCIAIDKLANPNRKVLLSNSHVIAAEPKHPAVHHPNFHNSSTDCSTHRIGNLLTDRFEFPKSTYPVNAITVDAAISDIKEDKASQAIIMDIGPVKGTYRIKSSDILNGDYKVWKRGAMTKITEGIVKSIEHTFLSKEDKLTWYNQILVEPTAGLNKGIMCVLGDSGSVLVNKDNMVVGLLHKGTRAGECIASHIDHVETKLNIRIWKENEVVAENEADAENEEFTIRPGIPQLLTNAVADLTAAGAGNFVAMVQSHYFEVFTLVKTNKQFAFAWFHNHGPQLIKQLRLAVGNRTKPIPSVIDQKLLSNLVSNIFTAMKKYGSEKLKATIETNEGWLLKIIELPYVNILEHFKQQQFVQDNFKPAYNE